MLAVRAGQHSAIAPLLKNLDMLLHKCAHSLMLCRSRVTRWSSMCHVFGDACSNAWYPFVASKAPLSPAEPGPILKGARRARAFKLSPECAHSSLLLLLLLELLELQLLLLPLELSVSLSCAALLFAAAMLFALGFFTDHTKSAVPTQQ